MVLATGIPAQTVNVINKIFIIRFVIPIQKKIPPVTIYIEIRLCKQVKTNKIAKLYLN